jgi:hypothetical protein
MEIQKNEVMGVGYNDEQGYFIMYRDTETVYGVSKEEAMEVVNYVKMMDGIKY